jgi:hypothetical protein
MRYEEFLVLTHQAGAFVRGGQVLVDGTIWGSSLRLLVEFPLERYELYAHTLSVARALIITFRQEAGSYEMCIPVV